MKCDFPANTKRITFKDITAPLDPITFNVRQKLLEQNALIVKLFLLFLLDREVKLDLSEHFADRVV